MISKRVSMEVVKKSSVVNLVEYLTNSQNKQERVDTIRVTNCAALSGDSATKGDALDAAFQMAAVQSKNTRVAGDKTYHLLISFRAGDNPDPQALKEIETSFCDALGFSEHQRVSAVHKDTDNTHIHVAINKIHPTKQTIHDPYNDNWVRDQLAVSLEEKYGLEPDNHIQHKTQSQARVSDMEAHSGQQSLVSWIKQECLSELKAAKSWEELNAVLSENGLILRERSNGFVLESKNGTRVKPSTVDRALSKPSLEKKLGPFHKQDTSAKKNSGSEYNKRPVSIGVDTARLYARYTEEKTHLSERKKKKLSDLTEEKLRRIEQAKNKAKLARAGLRLARGRVAKKIVHSQISRTLLNEIAEISSDIVRKRQELNQARPQVWADWLRMQAMQGDAEALAAMRARSNAAVKRAERSRAAGVSGSGVDTTAAVSGQLDSITKTGTIIYKVPGGGAVRDDGARLSLSSKAGDAALLFAMQTAAERNGSVLSLNGTADFQKKAAILAGRNGLAITFRDVNLEKIRKAESDNVRPQQGGGTDARSTNRRHAGGIYSDPTRSATRSAGDGRGAARNQPTVVTDRASFYRVIRDSAGKPYLGSSSRFPPPPPKNSMSNLSRLPMAFNARRSEVLVSPNARDGMDHKRADGNTALRRASHSASRLTEPHDLAAKKYVAERAEKRLRGFDIPKYSVSLGGLGSVLFVGVRHVEGCSLALLKKQNSDEIFVLPIDKKAEHRLAQIKRGSQVVVTSDSKILTKTGVKRRSR